MAASASMVALTAPLSVAVGVGTLLAASAMYVGTRPDPGTASPGLSPSPTY